MMLNSNVLRGRLVTLSGASLILALAMLVPTPAGADESFDRESLKIKDTVVLKSGSQIRGKFLSDVKEDGRKLIVFQSEDGGVLKLDLSKVVSKVIKANDTDKEYNQRIEAMDDTAEAHWNASKWCASQKTGKQRYKNQIRFHRERVMELDPNDDTVKKRLGYEFVDDEGRWVPTKEYWASMGYEKKGTRWAPMTQRVVSAQAVDARETAGIRKAAFKRWKASVRKKNSTRESLQNELYQICDANAVGIILAYAEKEKNPLLNELYIEAFGRIPTPAAMKGLIYFYMEDNSDRALTLLGQEHYPAESVAAVFSVFLRDTNNVRVNRAAFAIGELGAQNMILPLIAGLVTTHQVAPGKQAGRMQLGQGNGGMGGLGVGGKEAPKTLSFRNAQVIDALTIITNADFGYDAKPWLDWYVDNHTHRDLELRGPRLR